jgi:hypothetical protein
MQVLTRDRCCTRYFGPERAEASAQSARDREPIPPSPDADQVGQLRQIEAERLIKLWEKTRSTLDAVQPRIGTKSEKISGPVSRRRICDRRRGPIRSAGSVQANPELAAAQIERWAY